MTRQKKIFYTLILAFLIFLVIIFKDDLFELAGLRIMKIDLILSDWFLQLILLWQGVVTPSSSIAVQRLGEVFGVTTGFPQQAKFFSIILVIL